MELHDNAIIYSTYYQDAKKQIEKLKSINIDTTKLESELNDINKETENDISKADITLNNFGIEVYYQNGVAKLKKLLSTINNYNFYFQLNNLIKLLKLKLENLHNISIAELNIYIDDIENYLSQIKISSTIDYKDEETIIEELYNLAYILIKQEIILKDNSSLLEYINKSKIDSQKLDKIIHNEISKIELNKNKEIATRVYELDSEGIDSTYVDLKLLKLLSSHNKRSNFINNAKQTLNQEELEKLIAEYKENINKIKGTEELSKNKNSDIVNCKKELKQDRKTLAFSIISGVLSLATIISLGVWGIPKLSKVKKVKTTTYTYTDSYEKPEENIEYLKELDDTKTIIYQEFSPYIQKENRGGTFSSEREVLTYDLSDIELSNNLDYLQLNLEELDRTPEITTEEKEQLVPEDLYKETIKKLTIQLQDLEDYILEKDSEKFRSSITLYICLNYVLQVLLLVTAGKFDDLNVGIVANILIAIESLKDISLDKSQLINNKNEYEELIKQIKELINSNVELKNKFNEMYNQNINYYSNIKEIRQFYNQINGIKEKEYIINEKDYLELPEGIFNINKKEKIRIKKR